MGCPLLPEPLSLGTAHRAWPSTSFGKATSSSHRRRYGKLLLGGRLVCRQARRRLPALRKEGVCPQPLVWLPGNSSLWDQLSRDSHWTLSWPRHTCLTLTISRGLTRPENPTRVTMDRSGATLGCCFRSERLKKPQRVVCGLGNQAGGDAKGW